MVDWRPGEGRRRRENRLPDAFLHTQQGKLLELRTALVGSMNGSVREARLEKVESSAFSTHSADAGSDACDRDLVLSQLTQGANLLSDIDRALQRIEEGSYGTCEMSGKSSPAARLRALPFARFTVECQAGLEKSGTLRFDSSRSPFTVADEEEPESVAHLAVLSEKTVLDLIGSR